MGWAVRHMAGGHFHHLVNENDVADALLALLDGTARSDAEPRATRMEVAR
jgi:hypothetical protein